MLILVGTTNNQRLVEASHKPSVVNVMSMRFGMNAELSQVFVDNFFENKSFLLVDLNDYISGVELFDPKNMHTTIADSIPELIEQLSKIKQHVFLYGLRSYSKEKYVCDYYDASDIHCPPLRKLILDNIIAEL